MIEKAIEQQNEELKSSEKKLDLVKMELDEHSKDLLAKNEQLGSLQVLKVGEKEVADAKSSAASCGLEIETKQKELAVKMNQLNEIEKRIENRFGELKSKGTKLISLKKNLTSVSRELSLKKEQLESVKKQLKDRENEAEKVKISAKTCHEEFELKQKGLAMVNGLISDCNEELELKKKQLEKLQGLISISSNELDLKEGKLRGMEDSIRQCQNELDLIKKEFDATQSKMQGSLKELDWKLKKKQAEYNPGFTATIDGKSLQIHLNQHSKELDSMRTVVSMAFSLSSDPSMLVLDALNGFYRPHLKKGDNTEFEGTVVKKSCSLLLEEVMNLSPEIQPHVKIEASRIASDWLAKFTIDAEHSLEILCYLQLLCSYGLASIVDADKLLMMLEAVKVQRPAPALFRALGFANKVPGLIHRFIREKKLIEAINFSNTFKGMYQPVSLLNDFLRLSKIATKNLRKGNRTLEGQIDASKKRLADVKYAIRCIEECKIDSGPSVKSLEMQVTSLQKEINKWKEAALRDKVQKSKDGEKNLAAVIPAIAVKESATSPATASASISGLPHQLSGNKHPRADASAEKISKECHESIKVSEKEILDGNEAEVVVGDKIRGILHDWKKKQTLNQATIDVSSKTLESNEASASLDPSNEDQKKLLGVCEKNHLEDGEIAATLTVNLGIEETNVLVNLVPDYLPLERNEASASFGPDFLSVDPSKEELEKLLDMCEKNQLEDHKIAAVLRSAHDPRKLVLDIINVPETEEFKVKIPNSSCILLLKQLREVVIPEVNPEIRDEAKKVALLWQTTLANHTEKTQKSPLDVICFLQFLASFNVGSVFDPNQLLDLLDSDHWCKEDPDLCKILGLSDKIPSFIENRIKKGQHIEAVKYIYALNMVDKFPPVSVLEDFLSNLSKKTGKRPVKVQFADIDNEIKSLEDVIKCITDYKITGISPLKIEESIVQLKIVRERTNETPNIKPGLPELRNKRQRTHISPDYQVPLNHQPVPFAGGVLYLPPGPFVWPPYRPQWR